MKWCWFEHKARERAAKRKEAAPEPVRIDWHDADSDWPYFWLLDMRGEWVKLQGRDDPDGSKHDGDVFWVHRREIKTMQVESDAQQE